MKAVTPPNGQARRIQGLDARKDQWKSPRIHHVYTKEGRMERVVIPIHGNKTLKIGLQRGLMKIIPVSDDEL